MWWAIAVNGDQLELANVTPFDSLRENLGQKHWTLRGGKCKQLWLYIPTFDILNLSPEVQSKEINFN